MILIRIYLRHVYLALKAIVYQIFFIRIWHPLTCIEGSKIIFYLKQSYVHCANIIFSTKDFKFKKKLKIPTLDAGGSHMFLKSIFGELPF